MTSFSMPVPAWRVGLVTTALVFRGLCPLALPAQERNLTLTGRGTLEGERGIVRDVREVRLTLRRNGEFAATIVARDRDVVVRGRWNRPGLGNVDRIEVQEAERAPVRGDGTLAYADRDAMIPRRLALSWSGRAGTYRLEVEDRDVGGYRDDRPGRPDDRDRPDDRERDRDRDWRVGDRAGVYRNIDARADGDGRTRMSGVRGGAFSFVRARIGTGGDAILEIDAPTKGEIRGRVDEVRGRRVTLRVRSVYGYDGSGTITVTLRDDDTVARIEGGGTGERGRWTLDFRGRR